ncbi:leukocyte elastase inhibitor-like [Paramacrobiotus metropolitanus]|uniref:leukocyte elastase inhibitor-like n=1 Tax=Paramacrobiotus metropolitanus TaxID=2943436 RepID=UPI00244590F5|nr:leukocyte elastase inhibitor-like [Paramacrobiotus metropolitanus]
MAAVNIVNSSAAFDLSPVINNVSLSLYGAASSVHPEGNFLLSPISILYSAVLIYLGARGSSRDNLYSALDFQEFSQSGSDEDIAGAFGQLMNSLKLTTEKSAAKITSEWHGDTGNPAYRFQLALANGVFLRDGLKTDRNYLALVNQNLKAAIVTKDFAHHLDQARKDINKWTAERTGGHIKDLLPPRAIDGNTVAVLANAIYFKSRWERIFNEEYTKKNATFHLLNGETTTVQMMHMPKPRRSWNYAEDSDLDIQYVEIPYYEREASLLVFLPKQMTGLRDLEKNLTAQAIRKLAVKAEEDDGRMVLLSLPKFKVESSFDMVNLLKGIGVNDIFTEAADLKGMVPSGQIFVDKAFHKTVIDLNEKGTEAAGASGSLMTTRSGVIDPVDFIADHPFMYAIRHNPSKTILFIGRIEK